MRPNHPSPSDRGITRRGFVERAGALGVAAAGVGAFASDAVASTVHGHGASLGPLRVSRANPRYLADPKGRLVYLAGAETWGNTQDGFVSTAFGYGWGTPFRERAFLNMMSANNLNYIRLWLYESPYIHNFGSQAGQPDDTPHPVPWLRTGPGVAFDGKPKFDLTRIDPAYVARFRERVRSAGARGIYVSVMLFEGFSVLSELGQSDLAGWDGHPFNKTNNINGIDGDPNSTGQGISTHTLQVPAITQLQDRYVRTMLDALSDCDNVFYEIANESYGTAEWEYHIIDTIQKHEARKPRKHLTYMSSMNSDTTNNQILFESRADIIALGHNNSYLDDPPVADGTKVMIAETDHIGYTTLQFDAPRARAWAWKTFTRGSNPSLLDYAPNQTGFDEGNRAMGVTRRTAARVGLATMTPQGALSSTAYCLAHSGSEYLVYQPDTGAFSLTMRPGRYRSEWIDPSTGAVSRGAPVVVSKHTSTEQFTPPSGGDAVLHLARG